MIKFFYMETKRTIEPIAYIKTPFKEKFGIPRQSGRVKIYGEIFFCDKFNNPDAIRGLDGFSHIWLIFDFSLSHKDGFYPTVRPPRLGGNVKVGVFASRSPFRPNSLGLSCVKIEKINNLNGKISILVSGVDLIDNTPIYDIKPYLTHADKILNAKNGYAEKEKKHSIRVYFDKNLPLIDKAKLQLIKLCIKEDPKPAYIEKDRIFGMTLFNYNIKFVIKGKSAKVISIETLKKE